MTTPTLDDRELLDQIERAIRVMSKSLWKTPHRANGNIHIDRSGYAVLGSLDDLGETRLSDVAHHLQLDISTVSRQVKALEETGFITRRPDPEDKRAGLLDLSTPGRRELKRMRGTRVEILTSATSTWSADQRHQLLDLLEQLATGVSHASQAVWA